MGRVVGQAGVPVMLAGVAIDGFGFKAVADPWASAPVMDRAMLVQVADAIVLVETGILHVWVTFFLGLAFLLFGAATLLSPAVPRKPGLAGPDRRCRRGLRGS